jgi:hypothetical protein
MDPDPDPGGLKTRGSGGSGSATLVLVGNGVLCRDVAGMFATLEPLHAMMDKGPQTLKETSFSQAYGNELNEAQKWCKRYKVSNNIRDLNQARTY